MEIIMPIYMFTCQTCGQSVEKRLPVSERDNPGSCECSGVLRRNYSNLLSIGVCYNGDIDYYAGRHGTKTYIDKTKKEDAIDKSGQPA